MDYAVHILSTLFVLWTTNESIHACNIADALHWCTVHIINTLLT